MTKQARSQVDTDELAEQYSAKIGAARDRLLDVPSRARDRIPSLTIDDLAILDSLMRECLESIADTRVDDRWLNSLYEQWRPLVTDMPSEEKT